MHPNALKYPLQDVHDVETTNRMEKPRREETQDGPPQTAQPNGFHVEDKEEETQHGRGTTQNTSPPKHNTSVNHRTPTTHDDPYITSVDNLRRCYLSGVHLDDSARLTHPIMTHHVLQPPFSKIPYITTEMMYKAYQTPHLSPNEHVTRPEAKSPRTLHGTERDGKSDNRPSRVLYKAVDKTTHHSRESPHVQVHYEQGRLCPRHKHCISHASQQHSPGPPDSHYSITPLSDQASSLGSGRPYQEYESSHGPAGTFSVGRETPTLAPKAFASSHGLGHGLTWKPKNMAMVTPLVNETGTQGHNSCRVYKKCVACPSCGALHPCNPHDFHSLDHEKYGTASGIKLDATMIGPYIENEPPCACCAEPCQLKDICQGVCQGVCHGVCHGVCDSAHKCGYSVGATYLKCLYQDPPPPPALYPPRPLQRLFLPFFSSSRHDTSNCFQRLLSTKKLGGRHHHAVIHGGLMGALEDASVIALHSLAITADKFLDFLELLSGKSKKNQRYVRCTCDPPLILGPHTNGSTTSPPELPTKATGCQLIDTFNRFMDVVTLPPKNASAAIHQVTLDTQNTGNKFIDGLNRFLDHLSPVEKKITPSTTPLRPTDVVKDYFNRKSTLGKEPPTTLALLFPGINHDNLAIPYNIFLSLRHICNKLVFAKCCGTQKKKGIVDFHLKAPSMACSHPRQHNHPVSAS